MLTMIRSRHALTYAQLRQSTIGFGETTCKLRITVEFFVNRETENKVNLEILLLPPRLVQVV